MELEDYVEKLQKQKKTEKKERKKKEREEKLESRDQRRKLMKYTSSQKFKLSATGKKHMWKVFKERRKNYYNYPRGVVYLSSIPHGFFEEQMASYFSQFGKVTGIYMPRAPSGKIRGYAFIEFQLEVIAKIVAETMNNYLFYQRILKAKFIPPAQQKPYMFVFPFGDKRKKSVRIEAEHKRRETPLASEAAVEAYKRGVEQNMKRSMVKKMAPLGADYSIQMSGEAPAPVPSNQPDEKKIAAKKKLKQIAADLKRTKIQSKLASAETENPLDSKLAAQIQKTIAAKLAKPLRQMKNKKAPESEDENSESDDDDFETAEESSFFATDVSMDPADEGSSDSDMKQQSPAKKSKPSKSPAGKPNTTPKAKALQTSTPKSKKSPSSSSATKPGQSTLTPQTRGKKTAKKPAVPTHANTPTGLSTLDKTPKSAIKKTPSVTHTPHTPQVKSAQKKSLKVAVSEGDGSVSVKTPSKKKQSLKQTMSTPLASATKSDRAFSTSQLKTPENKSIQVQSPKSMKKSAKKSETLEAAVTPSMKKKPVAPLSMSREAKHSGEQAVLKRKSLSDARKGKLMNVGKKRKSLPK